MAAVDDGGLAWLVSTTSRVVRRVGPHTATTTNWPTGTETESGVLNAPALLAIVVPTGWEPIVSWTGLFGEHPCPDAVTAPPGGMERWSSASNRDGNGNVVVVGAVVGGTLVEVVGAVVVGVVVAGGVVTGGRVVVVWAG